MLLPALNKARENAKSIKCLSQVKQLMSAELQYTNDFDGYVKLADYNISNANFHQYWNYILWEQQYIDGSKPDIFVCPSISPFNIGEPETFASWGNAIGLRGIASTNIDDMYWKVERITEPAKTEMIADTVDTSDGIQNRYFGYQGSYNARWSVHLRHNTGANVAMLDGSASNEKLSFWAPNNILYTLQQKW